MQLPEIRVQISAILGTVGSLTLHEQVDCLQNVTSLLEGTITIALAGCVKHIESLKSTEEILELLDLNSRIVEISRNAIEIGSVMSNSELMVKVLDLHTAIDNVDVLCSALSVIENQAAVLKNADIAVINVIDKFADIRVHGVEIIEQALRTLTAVAIIAT